MPASIRDMASIHCVTVSKVSLRSLSATHLLYQGTDLYTIKRLLGHSSIRTTLRYLHLIPERFAELTSPLDNLGQRKGRAG